MPEITIFSTIPAHVTAMSDQLRAADVAELDAVGLRPGRALWRSYRCSTYARTAFVDEQPGAMWGVSGAPMGRVGYPWLLTTPAIERVKIAFLREAREEVAEMLTIYPALCGYVDASYRGAIRLLEKLGFEVGAALPFGAKNALFCYYHIERP